jgi:hypothetical protein
MLSERVQVQRSRAWVFIAVERGDFVNYKLRRLRQKSRPADRNLLHEIGLPGSAEGRRSLTPTAVRGPGLIPEFSTFDVAGCEWAGAHDETAPDPDCER